MRTLFFAVVAFLIFGGLSIAVADEADKAELARLFPKGAHRLQMSYTYLNAAEADFAIWVPSYSWAYSRRLRVTGLTGYADAKFHVPNAIDDAARSGLFDSFLVVQYDPGRRLTANSFVPNTLGLTFKLRAPTGDAAKGLGLDTWVGTVGAGWLVDFPYRFWLQPTIQYGHSLHQGSLGRDVETAEASLGLYWLFPFRAWLGIKPAFDCDLVLDDCGTNLSLTFGKSWPSGFTINLSADRLDRIDPLATRDDRQVFLSVSYQFGEPPPDR